MKEYKRPNLTVDGIILYHKKILLIKRKNNPFKGLWALPGGFVNYGENVEDAVVREVKEETGLTTKTKALFGVYSDPTRDPRGHAISIIYRLSTIGGKLKGGDDAAEACFFDMNELPKLAFDHNKIIMDYLGKVT